ncbi:MAG: hypothetical protein QMD85_04325, partial [Candidatus Aenigmarchaeota archaeon]|nr:hypothetical protein [Candidatus Aenigmarchaeota archaeon]MDI6722800.1 hypothetical protein [Candidatus Aenigmarchaeota archaeon]
IALKTTFGISWICEMMGQREEPFVSAKLLAYFKSENDMTIKTNDPCLSDFIFAFVRMNNLKSRTNGEIHNKALKEFSPKGMVAEIGVPIGYIKHMNFIVDSFANFLDISQSFYLLEKRIYIDKYQWEKDLRLLVKSMVSHLVGGSMDLLPEGVLEAVLRRSDRRRKDEIEPIVREALKDIEGGKRVEEQKKWTAKMAERRQAVPKPIDRLQEETKREEIKQEEKLPKVEQEAVTLKRRTIFDKYPTIHKRKKIGEE